MGGTTVTNPNSIAKRELTAALSATGAEVASGADPIPPDRAAELYDALRPAFVPGGMVSMPGGTKRVVAAWLFAIGVASFVGVIWMWRVVDVLTNAPGQQPVVRLIRWIGPDFPATASSATLVLMACAAVGGSVVHMVTIFTHRAGRRTLEAGYAYWYFLRPVASGVLGVLFGLVVRAGLSTIGSGNTEPDVTTLVVAGALAGLFTDRIIQQMLRLLGSTNPAQPAMAQDLPYFPPDTGDGGRRVDALTPMPSER